MVSNSSPSRNTVAVVYKKDSMCAFCRAFLYSVNNNEVENAALFARSFLLTQLMNGSNGKAAA